MTRVPGSSTSSAVSRRAATRANCTARPVSDLAVSSATSSGGRIYLHRRSDTKDWAPGHWDAAAGGVIALGEVPRDSAMRELSEELGITGVTLVDLGAHLYQDDTVRCFEYAYETVWDGRAALAEQLRPAGSVTTGEARRD